MLTLAKELSRLGLIHINLGSSYRPWENKKIRI